MASMDVIREYLISLGFHVNEDSLNSAKQSVQGVEGMIKGFANSNMENMSSMQSFFKLFNSSIRDNLGVVSKIVPEAKLPLLQIVSFAELLYKAITKVTKGLNNVKSNKIKQVRQDTKKAANTMQDFSKKTQEAQPPIVQLIALIKELTLAINKLSDSAGKVKVSNFSDVPKALGKTTGSLTKVSKESGNTTKSLAKLKDDGGKNVKEFAETSGLSIKSLATRFAAFTAAGVGIWKMLSSLGKQDLGYQKLATQLWTTTENAKEVSMALGTMKVSLKDLWLSPELLQQFNQLRKDSAELKLPSDYEDNLKIVRSIAFEFQRLKQAGTLAFQWIGYYISKYCAGPLANVHQALNSFTNGLLKNIPSAAKVIGTALGLVFRLLLTIIEALSIAMHPILELISLVATGLSKLPGPLQNIIKLVTLLGIAMKLGPLGIILLLLLALDDLFTYMKGGHSLIGKFFDQFKSGAKVINDLKNKFKGIKDTLLGPIRAIEGGWNSFWKGIETYIDNIEKKFKKLVSEIKNSALGKTLSSIHDAIPNAKSKIEGFASDVKKGASNMLSYIMPTTNNKSSTTNNATHNNSQSNTFNIYGNDANSTATAVSNKLGVNTRNLQGVVD